MHRNFVCFMIFSLIASACVERADVLVIGGGAGGTCAGIASARHGAKTVILEETPWAGGMLTSAGVSAIDGNYRLRGGLFGEFCDSLAKRYGSLEKLHSGWVSRIMYSPKTGAEVLKNIISKERGLKIEFQAKVLSVKSDGNCWEVRYTTKTGPRKIKAKIVIDGTELGDAAAMAGAEYEVGLAEMGGAVQDMTYVLLLKDFGHDVTIARPEGYDAEKYRGSTSHSNSGKTNGKGQTLWTPEMMMSYGRLPDGEIMLNWPIEGNDFYANVVDSSDKARNIAYNEAKKHSLGFLYYIQTELGYNNYGISDKTFPTADGLPFYPYHREARRIISESSFELKHIYDPYCDTLYKASVAVGDYPIDHHHYANPRWAEFPSLYYKAIPSFSVPFSVLVPVGLDNFLMADKATGVSNLVNGATRLQPVVMSLGQAAGTAAAIAVKRNCSVRSVPVNAIQDALIRDKAYILPYLDAGPEDKDFEVIQRIGASGILRGTGRSVDWSNETLFRTEEVTTEEELHLEEYFDKAEASKIKEKLLGLTRRRAAVIIDSLYRNQFFSK